MTYLDAKRELQTLFSVIFPAKSDHTIDWQSTSYKQMVLDKFAECRPHFDFTSEELHALAAVWLSDRELTETDLSRLSSMCAAW